MPDYIIKWDFIVDGEKAHGESVGFEANNDEAAYREGRKIYGEENSDQITQSILFPNSGFGSPKLYVIENGRERVVKDE